MNDFADVLAVFTDAGGDFERKSKKNFHAGAWMAWDYKTLEFFDYGFEIFKNSDIYGVAEVEYATLMNAVKATSDRCNRVIIFTEMLDMVKWIKLIRQGDDFVCRNESQREVAYFLANSKAEFHYIPAHSGIAFNLAVDKLAGQLVGGGIAAQNEENIGVNVANHRQVEKAQSKIYNRFFVLKCMSDPDNIPEDFGITYQEILPTLKEYSQAWDMCLRDAAQIRRDRKEAVAA